MDAHLERLMTRRRFSSRGNSGRETLDVAELASYTMVANLILNFDGTITEE